MRRLVRTMPGESAEPVRVRTRLRGGGIRLQHSQAVAGRVSPERPAPVGVEEAAGGGGAVGVTAVEVRTAVRGGRIVLNHSADVAALAVRTGVRAGRITVNHSWALREVG
jgi:hypothetical protein